MEQEKKLAEYRARKKREQQIQQVKDNVKNLFSWKKDSANHPENEDLIDENEAELSTEETPRPSPAPSPEPTEKIYPTSKIRREFYILFAVLWVATYVLFIQIQFGIVYLIISALFFIYLNTRTGPKGKDEVSAYSVFNKNCESIDGTLKGEQFEREIRFGALNVH